MKKLSLVHLNFALFAMIALPTLIGCSPESSGGNITSTTISGAAIIASADAAADRAEKLANAADVLFSSGALRQANDLCDAALVLDPTNVRAGLIKAISRPMTLLEGFAQRLSTYADTDLSNNSIFLEPRRRLQTMIDEKSDSYSKPAMDDFIYHVVPGGRPDIKSEADLQSELDGLIKSFDELREFVKTNKDNEISITATTTLIPDLMERYANACRVTEDAKLVYRLDCPPEQTRNMVMLNRADFEMVGDMASFYEFALILAASYDLTSLPALNLANETLQRSSTGYAQASIDQLLASNQFGHLRKSSRLTDLKGLGLDLVGGLNWVISNQNILCKSGNSDDSNRVGSLFNKGFCLGGARVKSYLTVISDAVSGKVQKLNLPNGAAVDFSPFALFDHPPADLRELGPFKFADSAALTSVGDQTLGGVFPNGDIGTVLSAGTHQ